MVKLIAKLSWLTHDVRVVIPNSNRQKFYKPRRSNDRNGFNVDNVVDGWSTNDAPIL